MEWDMIILRFVHIGTSTFWVGAALINLFFLEPTVRATGASGGQFMTRLVEDRHFGQAISFASLATVLSGSYLYWEVSVKFNRDWITTNAGLFFTVGAIAGLAAFVLGLAFIAPSAGRLSHLSRQLQQLQGPPPQELIAKLQAAQARLHLAGVIEAPLIIFAVIAMAIARYL